MTFVSPFIFHEFTIFPLNVSNVFPSPGCSGSPEKKTLHFSKKIINYCLTTYCNNKFIRILKLVNMTFVSPFIFHEFTIFPLNVSNVFPSPGCSGSPEKKTLV
ncbi:hypothetical protein CHX27_11220 [Flavobacterium aurantiibacter]|uniref:Uncharacterized protein n=1 Tax=Flavobacterium aurantiibacter TaxID=2023067 RepID=A0A255ZPZ0_9FLAO|nr:hypothetical protein CHX27_11220 [Flavobacterium aurantiibacter]